MKDLTFERFFIGSLSNVASVLNDIYFPIRAVKEWYNRDIFKELPINIFLLRSVV